MTASIVKYEKPRASDFDRFVLGMYVLYCTRPADPKPTPEGAFFIGTVEDAKLDHQRLQRWSPYSICQRVRE